MARKPRQTATAPQNPRDAARLAADIDALLVWYAGIGGADGLAQAQDEITAANAALEVRFAARNIH